MPNTKRKPLQDRLWERVTKTATCWLWTGAIQPYSRKNYGGGYGVIGLGGRGGKTVRVHRLVYELLVGPVPSGKVLDHTCRNPRCCNPEHLEPVTNQENVKRGLRSALLPKATHCRNGHPLTPDNLYPRADGNKKPRCKKCLAATHLRWRRKHGIKERT